MATTQPRSRDLTKPITTTSQTKPASRYSSFSKTQSDNSSSSTNPSFSTNSLSSMDPRLADMRIYTAGLDRLESKKLQQQRYPLSPEQEFNMTLGAKVHRALERRMSDQDAVMRPRPKRTLTEKVAS